MTNKTANQAYMEKRNANYAARKIVNELEESGCEMEMTEKLREKVTSVITALILHNAECHEFIHHVLTSGAYQDYQCDAHRILGKDISY